MHEDVYSSSVRYVKWLLVESVLMSQEEEETS